jgi:hypothetical protein
MARGTVAGQEHDAQGHDKNRHNGQDDDVGDQNTSCPSPFIPMTCQAWLRLVSPKALVARLGWLLQIHAVDREHGPQFVAKWGAVAAPSAAGDDPGRGLYEAQHTRELADGDGTALMLSVRLDEKRYTQGYATVRVAGHSDANDPLLERGDLITDEEYLIG